MLCFEVRINDGPPVTAGAEEISVLAAMVNYVAKRHEIDIRVGGLVSPSEGDCEHLDWIEEDLRVGDSISIRVVESEEPAQPASRRRDDPELAEREKRMYFEKLRKEYGE